MIFQKNSLNQKSCQRLEKADPIYLVGKSAYELLELILKKILKEKK